MTICEKNSTELFQPASKLRCGRFAMRRQKSFEIMNDDCVFEDEAGPLLTSIRMREHAKHTMLDTIAIRDPASKCYSLIAKESMQSRGLPASKSDSFIKEEGRQSRSLPASTQDSLTAEDSLKSRSLATSNSYSFTDEESRESRNLPASNSYSCTNTVSRQSKDNAASMNHSLATDGNKQLEEDPDLKNFLFENKRGREGPFVTNYQFEYDLRKQPGRSGVVKSCSFSHKESKQLETMPCWRSDVVEGQSSIDSPCRQCYTIQSDHFSILSLNSLPSRLQTHNDRCQKSDTTKRQACSETVYRECDTIRHDKGLRLSSDNQTSRQRTHTDQYQKFDTTKRQSFSATICRECDTIREHKSRRLSLDNLTSRTPNRSSQILNWLKNPENQFMFQDKGTEGHIFRSHSAVQNRPNFAKATRYYSLREQGRDCKECVSEISALFENCNAAVNESSHLTDKPVSADAVDDKVASETSNERNALNLKTSGDSDFHKRSVGLASEEIFIENFDDSSLGETDDQQNGSCYSDFVQKQRHDEKESKQDASEISFKMENLNLSMGWDASFQDHRSITSSNSLPNYGKSKREGTLRRINSDALFYKGVFRNSDRRNTFGFRKRQSRLSIKLRDLVDASRGMSSQDTGIDSLESNSQEPFTENIDVNSKEFIDNIERIVLHGDVQDIRELADCGYDFNVKDRKGNCGLHYAAERGSEKIVTEILENGGSVWVRNTKNQLPVDLASNINVLMLLSGATMFFRGQYKHEIETRLFSKGMSFEL